MSFFVIIILGRPVSDRGVHCGPSIISFDSLFPIIQNILQRSSKVFTKIFPIPSAKMPIIKFVHKRTQINCDISFKHCTALFNTELVKFYVSMDTRFKTLMIILKYWMYKCKSRKVIQITNYSLSMLVIFFLQQLKLVPTVIELQRKCKVPVTCKGWQVNFEKSVTSWDSNRHCENLGIPKLLEKFFEFYKNYDFDSFVICPFDGQSHNKKVFKDCKDLPATMSRYIDNVQNGKNFSWRSKVCLQDPIELNVNLTHNITAAQLDKFQSYACIYSTVVKDAANNNYQDLLKNLFSDHKTNIATVTKQVSFSIYPNEFSAISSAEDIKENYIFIKNNWFDLTFAMIEEYLEKVLNFKLQISQSEKDSQKENFKISLNSSTENHPSIFLHCTGNYCLWKDRKQVKILRDISPLEKEIEMSKILLESKQSEITHTIKIDFKCAVTKKVDSNSFIDLTLINQGCARSIFADVAHFLSSHMTSVIKKNQNYLLHTKKKKLSKLK